jgi:hypothetical protein
VKRIVKWLNRDFILRYSTSLIVTWKGLVKNGGKLRRIWDDLLTRIAPFGTDPIDSPQLDRARLLNRTRARLSGRIAQGTLPMDHGFRLGKSVLVGHGDQSSTSASTSTSTIEGTETLGSAVYL